MQTCAYMVRWQHRQQLNLLCHRTSFYNYAKKLPCINPTTYLLYQSCNGCCYFYFTGSNKENKVMGASTVALRVKPLVTKLDLKPEHWFEPQLQCFSTRLLPMHLRKQKVAQVQGSLPAMGKTQIQSLVSGFSLAQS